MDTIEAKLSVPHDNSSTNAASQQLSQQLNQQTGEQPNQSLSTQANKQPNKRPRPVLMIPLRRCGSHALRLRLNNSREFFSPYPLHVVDFVHLLPRYGDLQEDANYFRLIVDVIGLQAASMVKWKNIVFDPVEIFEAIRAQKRSVHRILWEMLLRAGEQESATIVMDKSLDSVHYAEELLDLYPDMLFLNVVRDPRAQVASMNRAIIHDYDSCLNALTWRDAHLCARRLVERHPERVLTIRFEDFLQDQEALLRQVCAFFGIEFLPQMLDVENSHEAQNISRLSALWENNCKAPMMEIKDKFMRQLSMQEIEVIETITREFMDLYGYETITPAAASFSYAGVEVAIRDSEMARANAWDKLKSNSFKDYTLRRFRAEYLSNLAQVLPDPRKQLQVVS